jgi:hypothetical protein
MGTILIGHSLSWPAADLLKLEDGTACFFFFLFPVKRIIVLTAEVKMDTQILVGGQSGVRKTFSKLPLVVIYSQRRVTIFRFV